jgi:predicted alpha/beta hydrolase family esterase
MNKKVIFIPGNGGGTPRDSWFPNLQQEFEKLDIKVIAKDFPDNNLARAQYWLPFIKELGADENTILIGHSSGAVAAMRFAEENKIFGSVLVSACYTDLGDGKEKQSGYYNTPWKWEKIKMNQKWIIQFASTDDPWIPISEAHLIKKKLNTIYY